MQKIQDKYGLTVQEVVQVLGISERKVRELIAQDEIPHFRVGRAVRIPRQPLKAWMDNGVFGLDFVIQLFRFAL